MEEPGIKIVTLKVTDDDGSESTAQLFVNVLNQIPIADFSVRATENGETTAIDFRAEDAFVDVPYTFDALSSFDIDSSTGDSSKLEYNWTFGDDEYRENAISTFTFTEPGIHIVSLVVTDEYGAQSLTKTITVRVQNPLPIISVRILDGWIDGEHMDVTHQGRMALFQTIGLIPLIMTIIHLRPRVICCILIQRELEMVIGDMKANTLQ